MLYLILGLCAMVATVVHVSYWFKKHRLLDQEIDRAIQSKIMASPQMAELVHLREERMVMRNLLHDILDNETSLRLVTPEMSDDDKMRLMNLRNQRRRELFGESLLVLGKVEPEVVWQKRIGVSEGDIR
jgi:uncharacterized protein YdcH (DUF465 family)